MAPEGVVPGPSESRDSSSGVASIPPRFAPPATLPSSSSSALRASTSRVETVQRFARELGVSQAVARQLAQCHCPSSQRLYQHRWLCYREWCVFSGHTISSIPKVADFLLFLRKWKHLALSSVKGFRSMLSSVFKFRLLEIQTSPLLHDLIHFFELERPSRSPNPLTWDLVKVLMYLRTFGFS